MRTRTVFLIAAALAVALVLLLWYQQRGQAQRVEAEGVFRYVQSHPQLKALVGDPVPTQLIDARRGEGTVTYEFDIGGTKPLHAIVDVRGGSPELRCVTRRRPRERDPGKDACAQDPVELPPVAA
jgi:hypothetical protein